MIRKEIETLAINIDEVHTHPANVRQGDVGAISESLKAHGQYRPIVYFGRQLKVAVVFNEAV